jgi:large subunit ribosomal protein L33
MAKKNTILLKLVSTAGTGFYYVKRRNPKKLPEKLSFRKYDPVVRKHVLFKEEKLKS